jgi:hypothetical protein
MHHMPFFIMLLVSLLSMIHMLTQQIFLLLFLQSCLELGQLVKPTNMGLILVKQKQRQEEFLHT